MEGESLTLVLAGHVDHGKSTLVGRLLHELGALAEGKIEAVRAGCERRGVPFEWSFVLDALQAERDQSVTIDISRVWFALGERRISLIDAPGHREFLKNMVTGAAQADAALLVVDAREGMREQSRKHAFLLQLLGIRRVIVAVNKMDLAGYGETPFREVERACGDYLARLGLEVADVIPVSAREGDNLAAASAHMTWYRGKTLAQGLAALPSPPPPEDLPLRLPVQDIYKFDERRILVGRVESGILKTGDELLFSPANVRAKVASIEAWPENAARGEAQPGECVGFTLTEPVFIERGALASHVAHPPLLTTMFRARIFWLGAEPLDKEKRYRLRIGTMEISAELREIGAVIHADTLEREAASQIERGMVAEVIFRTRGMVAVDAFGALPHTGRFVIMHGYEVGGGGVIDLTGFADQRVTQPRVKSTHITPHPHAIGIDQRAVANGHLPGILWFTGLSGAGKSTLAQGLQKKLFAKGYQVFVLDGDNIRKGLNRDLGFSPDERKENLRRAGEVASLFAQAGFIVITSFISPTHEDRAVARAASPDWFHSVHIRADLDTCERRDAKGLYRKARSGEIAEFTGISAPYEPPLHPDLTIDTMAEDVESCINRLVRYVERQFVEPVRSLALPGASAEPYDFLASGI